MVAACVLFLWLSCGSAGDAALALADSQRTEGMPASAAETGGEVPLAPGPSPLRRVRPVQQGVREAASLLLDAERRSVTVSGLLAALEQTDLILYVERVPSARHPGQFAAMADGRGFRMFRISLDARIPPDDQVKWLGHELAHALEVAQAPGVRGPAGLKLLYLRIGRRVGEGDDYETDGAEATGRRVAAELSNKR